jgi:hypothetical protein
MSCCNNLAMNKCQTVLYMCVENQNLLNLSIYDSDETGLALQTNGQKCLLSLYEISLKKSM